MKVSDVMSTVVDYVQEDTSIKDVCRLIFGRGINGVPVCKGTKIVGFIIERDILAKFYPSMQDYMEDPYHTSDFEDMETKLSEILSLKAKDLMTTNPSTISADTPLLRAQSLMFIYKVGRMPVVDSKGNLVGILSKGDIFKSVVGGRIPYVEDEEYHDWLSRRYDLVVSWDTRLKNELPDLLDLFKEKGVKRVVDIGCGTGEHILSLAKNGFGVVGIERSGLMCEAAESKRQKLEDSVKRRVEFVHRENYVKELKGRKQEFDAAIFMGNALAHNPSDYKKIIEAIDNSLTRKGVVVLQLVNLDKVFMTNKRLQDFNIAKSKTDKNREYAFIEFYDQMGQDSAMLNMAVFQSDGKGWTPRGINRTQIAYITKTKIASLLKKNGFSKVNFYGGTLLGPLFTEEFDPLKSDYLNVIAQR